MPMMNRFVRQAFAPTVTRVPMAWAPPPPPPPPNPSAYVYPDPPPATKTSTLNAPLAFLPTPAWSSNLFAKRTDPSTGQTIPGVPDTVTSLGAVLAIAGTGLGIYHGYKRTESPVWTVLWGLFGGTLPVIALPWMYAQGFAKRKGSRG